jgi:hypothetical protein
MRVAAQLHWVKAGFVMDGDVSIDRRGFTARAIKGAGPIEDLRDLGVAAGWRGAADVSFDEIRGDFTRPLAAAGNIRVSGLAAAQVADGGDLGNYDLQFAPGAVAADGSVNAQLVDSGGPLDVQAQIRYALNSRTATLTGTLKERAEATPALRSQLESFSQLRGRDSQGRIPLDFEVTL